MRQQYLIYVFSMAIALMTFLCGCVEEASIPTLKQTTAEHFHTNGGKGTTPPT